MNNTASRRKHITFVSHQCQFANKVKKAEVDVQVKNEHLQLLSRQRKPYHKHSEIMFESGRRLILIKGVC